MASPSITPLFSDDRLKVADILQARKLHVPSYGLAVQPQQPSAVICLQQGQGASATSTYSYKPEKRVFSIVSWNIQDYKGSKIHENRICNWFVKHLSNLLEVDLLVILESCDDLTEMIGAIDESPVLLMDPNVAPVPTVVPPAPDDTMDVDDAYYDMVRARAEALAGELPDYIPVGTDLTHDFVDLPDTFTDNDFQKGLQKMKADPRQEIHELLVSLYQAYDITVNGIAVNYDQWEQRVLASKNFPTGTVFTLRNLCRDCNGSKVAAVAHPLPCVVCSGVGQIYSCDTCEGRGVVPAECDVCQGTGSFTHAGASIYCPECNGTGRQWDQHALEVCPTCHDDFEPNLVCPGCNGAKNANQCRTCNGLGTLADDVRANILQDLRRILGDGALKRIDVETYTLLWRRGEGSDVPSQFRAGGLPATGDKAVWLHASNVALQSKDRMGVELGYQDTAKLYNSRVPVVIPIALYMDGKRLFTPFAAFHTIWTDGTGKMDKARIESLRNVPSLAVADMDQGAITDLASADGCIILGDMNLDFAKKKSVKVEYKNLENQGYIPKVPGTKTVFTPTHELIKRFGKNGALVYETASYDQFFVKGAELNNNVIACGVIDVVDIFVEAMNTYPNLTAYINNEIAADAQDAKEKGKVPSVEAVMNSLTPVKRAIYAYRKFVSDHLPIILDLKVDAMNVFQRQQRERQQAEAQRRAQWNAEQPPVTNYNGTWTNIAVIPGPNHGINSHAFGAAQVTGRVAAVTPDSLTVEVVNPIGNRRFCFQGPVAPGAWPPAQPVQVNDFIAGRIQMS